VCSGMNSIFGFPKTGDPGIHASTQTGYKGHLKTAGKESVMAYSEGLAERVRSALVGIRRVEEKKMFGGLAFMVDGKMCITVGPRRIMVRIDPGLHESAIRRKGARTVRMGRREYVGFVYVDAEGVRSRRQLDFWLKLALDFNKRVKSHRSGKPK
jgi:TfoX/Sxy family transcriptional regulator of competence genes